jgi:hypothetical protein
LPTFRKTIPGPEKTLDNRTIVLLYLKPGKGKRFFMGAPIIGFPALHAGFRLNRADQ